MAPMSLPDSASPALIAIVPAAGVGLRASRGSHAGPKQYRQIAGKTMLRWSVEALLAERRITRVVVAVAPGDGLADAVLSGLPRTAVLACGGETRHETVANALDTLRPGPRDWVLVHDAARPGLPPEALARLIDTCLQDAVGGLLALPVADTVKEGEVLAGGSRVARTLSRENLWQAQTPQMFRAGLLAEAFATVTREGFAPTDEAGAVEAAGHRPLLVPGAMANAKVTWPDDFAWMERWLG